VNESVSVILVGIGGYGEVYLSALVDELRRGRCRLTAAVDPSPERCSRLAELRSQGVPIHASLEELPAPIRARAEARGTPPASTGAVELVVISSPIHLHCPHTCQALARGSYVLCEKPVAATIQEVDQMIEARDRAGRFVAIGYQWSYSSPIQRLKQDIQVGLFGRPRRLKSLCLWPRDASYYGRNNWAGRLRDDQGRWVLDSPANNAMAHDLHNMLYVLGDHVDASARPADVTAEIYRANPIENFDTAAVRVRTVNGVEVLFFGSHAVRENMDPVFSFEFDDAVVNFAAGQSPIVAQFKNGTRKEYASPLSEPQAAKMSICLDAIAGIGTIPCGLEAAKSQTICVNGVAESMPEATEFAAELVSRTGEGPKRLIYVEALPQILRACFDHALLPSELGVPWARCGRTVDVRDYAWYPGGRRQ
jgi:predicted dehydrogenase